MPQRRHSPAERPPDVLQAADVTVSTAPLLAAGPQRGPGYQHGLHAWATERRADSALPLGALVSLQHK